MNMSEALVSYDDDSNEIVYAEMNLEKWPIWEPSSTQKIFQSRIFERERILPNGNRIAGRVEIGFTQHGCLSTRDQKVYYILLKMWDDMGRLDTPVFFSLQKIARLLGEEWGSKARRAISDSLLRLRGVLFVWENSYFDKATGEHLELLDTFNILSELTIARRSDKVHATNAMCEFRFHAQLLKSLHANYTTPLSLETVLGFRSEIAQILYPRLDLFLADKNHYERRTKELFEDLGLRGETYRHRSARKRLLDRALVELQGVPLTTGRITSATIEPTKDNLDFKLVVHKGSLRKPGRPRKVLAPDLGPAPTPPTPTARRAKREASHALKARAPETSSIWEAPYSEVSSSEGSSEGAPEALVRYFQQAFHGAPSEALSPRETARAARLLKSHGLDGAREMVDFAHAEAAKTKYAAASLNGILQYEARFTAARSARERARNEEQERQDQQRRTREAQERHQREVADTLLEQVDLVRERAPQAFLALAQYIDAERQKFLQTPIARRARPETRELLSREYDRPARRLEFFVEFFGPTGQGKQLLGPDPRAREVTLWLRAHKDVVSQILHDDDLHIDPARLMI